MTCEEVFIKSGGLLKCFHKDFLNCFLNQGPMSHSGYLCLPEDILFPPHYQPMEMGRFTKPLLIVFKAHRAITLSGYYPTCQELFKFNEM